MRKEHRHGRGENLIQNVELTFTSHAKELIIGDIFIRIYNAQPEFTIEVYEK